MINKRALSCLRSAPSLVKFRAMTSCFKAKRGLEEPPSPSPKPTLSSKVDRGLLRAWW